MCLTWNGGVCEYVGRGEEPWRTKVALLYVYTRLLDFVRLDFWRWFATSV